MLLIFFYDKLIKDKNFNKKMEDKSFENKDNSFHFKNSNFLNLSTAGNNIALSKHSFCTDNSSNTTTCK